MKHTFPENYGEGCILVEIDKALVPLVAGALKPFERRFSWVSDEDYEQGYNAFAELQVQFMGKCVQALIDSNDRIYRLLDTALNGVAYTATPATSPPPAAPPDPTRPTISPAIPTVPAASSPAQLAPFALRSRLERLINLADNLSTGQTFPLDPAFLSDSALNNNTGLRETIINLQGMLNAGWFGIGGQNATLADVVNALRIGSEADAEKVTDALDILSGGASSAVIFSTVQDLFSDVVGATGEGAILGTLIAASIANAAMAGSMAAQLDRIIQSLDGGGLTGPGDNVLTALRGDDQADENRNLASLLSP
jgi:hypothetical protein